MKADADRTPLIVELGATRVGTLTRNRAGLTSFVPDSAWVELEQRPRLGVAFLRDSSPRRQGTGLPAWFENLLPEASSALRRRICAQLGVRETDSYALITELGLDLPGAVVVRPDASALDDGERGGTEPESAEKERASDTEPGRLRFSLAGVQLKFSMILRDQKLTLPVRGETGFWIVKIPSRDFPELPAVEHASMTWARRCGIPVAETRIMSASDVESVGTLDLPEDASVLAVRRFDRSEQGGRVHHEDLLQVLEWHPTSKYAEQPNLHIGYDGIAHLIYELAGLDEALDFVRRLAFVVACGNDDAHLKNWSLLWPADASRPVLTPAYDLVATLSLPAYQGWKTPHRKHQPSLALPLGGERSWHDLSAERVRTFAARSTIPHAESVFHEALVRARDAFQERKESFPPCMRAGIPEHWSRVALLRHIGLERR